MKKKYEVRKEENGSWRVYDTNTNTALTTDVPEETIAQEIADDFNAMENKDYRPLGLPNFSKN